MRIINYVLLLVLSQSAFGLAPELTSILDKYNQTSATLNSTSLSYSVFTEARNLRTSTSDEQGATTITSVMGHTTNSVKIAHRFPFTRYTNSFVNSIETTEVIDKVWSPTGTHELTQTAAGEPVVLVQSSSEFAQGDVLSLLEYWVYTGIVPSWITLSETEQIEYNFSRRDFNRAVISSDSRLTTVTFDGRESYVFNSIDHSLLYTQVVDRNGRLMMRSALKYHAEVSEFVPSLIEVELYAPDGSLSVKKVIRLNNLSSDIKQDFLVPNYPVNIQRFVIPAGN